MRHAFTLLFLNIATGLLAQVPHGERLYTPVVAGPEGAVIRINDYFPGAQTAKVLPNYLCQNSPSEDQGILLLCPTAQPISTVTIETDQTTATLVVMASSRKPVTIAVNLPQQEEPITIFGSLNAWNRQADTLTYDFKARAYVHTFQLNPGRYEYKLMNGKKEMLDPSNPDSISNGMGGYNNLLVVEGPQGEEPTALYPAWENNQLVLHNLPANQVVIALWNNQLLTEKTTIEPNRSTTRSFQLPEMAKKMERSHVRFYSYRGSKITRDVLLPISKGAPLKEASKLNRWDWHAASLYFLMVDRFLDGNPKNNRLTPGADILPQANYQGGDLDGVTQALNNGYFDQLHVNTIWLSPITQNPLDAWGLWDKGCVKTRFSGYHGYWPITSTTVDFRFGTEETVKNLLATAHQKNYNVLLDYVANHVHLQHNVYVQHPDWATSLYLPDGSMNTERWDEHRLTTWFDTHLPTLDLSRKEVTEPMADSALFWVTTYDFDGFRHDATKHIDELYWRTLTAKMKLARPEASLYQIGETYGSPELIHSYISTGMLDAQFDFNLYDAAVEAFALDAPGYGKLPEVLDQSLDTYGAHHLMGNISGNQDRARFISLAGGDISLSEDLKLAGYTRKVGVGNPTAYSKLLLLHAFNIMVPGVPCIYYGDEYGLPGANDPDNRRLMQFTNLQPKEEELRKLVARLFKLRSSHMPLLYGSTNVERLGTHGLLIRRSYLDKSIVAVFNNSAEPISLPDLPPKHFPLFSNASIVTGELPAYSVYIYSENP